LSRPSAFIMPNSHRFEIHNPPLTRACGRP
jgi:hypothetical protein